MKRVEHTVKKNMDRILESLSKWMEIPKIYKKFQWEFEELQELIEEIKSVEQIILNQGASTQTIEEALKLHIQECSIGQTISKEEVSLQALNQKINDSRRRFVQMEKRFKGELWKTQEVPKIWKQKISKQEASTRELEQQFKDWATRFEEAKKSHDEKCLLRYTVATQELSAQELEQRFTDGKCKLKEMQKVLQEKCSDLEEFYDEIETQIVPNITTVAEVVLDCIFGYLQFDDVLNTLLTCRALAHVRSRFQIIRKKNICFTYGVAHPKTHIDIPITSAGLKSVKIEFEWKYHGWINEGPRRRNNSNRIRCKASIWLQLVRGNELIADGRSDHGSEAPERWTFREFAVADHDVVRKCKRGDVLRVMSDNGAKNDVHRHRMGGVGIHISGGNNLYLRNFTMRINKDEER